MKKLFTLFAAALFATNISAQDVVYLDPFIDEDLEGEQTESLIAVEYPATDKVPATIVDGAGVDGSRGIKVVSTPGFANDWDTQFFIVLDQMYQEKTTLHIEFDYKASNAYSVGTQSHAEPGDYNIYYAIGDVKFTTQWQHFEKDVEIDAFMAHGGEPWSGKVGDKEGLKSIAFNLAKSQDETIEYYFDNFKVCKAVVPKPVWLNVIPNGDCEADAEAGIINDGPVYSFVCREMGKNDQVNIVDGLGVDESRCVVIESAAEAPEDWSTQFFITTNHVFEPGERVKVKFDYRADLEDGETVNAGTQAHALPGDYIFYQCAGTVTFTNAWDTYEYDWKVTEDMTYKKVDDVFVETPLFQTVTFNLNANKEKPIKFYFDNIKFFVDEPNATYDDFAMNEKIDEIATGVKSLKAQKNAKNVRVNLAGQQVDSNYKGFVIENGKKFVIK
jgi:hypothetical protein